jgi:hypothetical protein
MYAAHAGELGIVVVVEEQFLPLSEERFRLKHVSLKNIRLKNHFFRLTAGISYSFIAGLWLFAKVSNTSYSPSRNEVKVLAVNRFIHHLIATRSQ